MSVARVKQSPLLYITQPKTTKPILNAQTTYIIEKKIVKEAKEPIEVSKDVPDKLPSELNEFVELNPDTTITRQEAELIKMEENTSSIDEITKLEITENQQITKEDVSAPPGDQLESTNPAGDKTMIEVTEQQVVEEKVDAPSSVEKNQLGNKRELGFRRVKPFRAMSVNEKLNYLIAFPRPLTPVYCLFSTSDFSYSGILINQFEDEVEIKLLNGETAKIKTDAIKNIKIQVLH